MSTAGPFDPSAYGAFRFDSFRVDESACAVDFTFTLVPREGADASPWSFTERIGFSAPAGGATPDWAAARGILPLLGAVLGLSYYKAAAPPVYEVAVDGLAAEGAAFLKQALRHGLAEFAYRAGLPALLATEVTVTGAPAASRASVALEGERLARPLAPVGGGKDSVVTVESLRLAGLDVTQFSVNPNAIMRRVAEAAGLPFVTASRTLDPALFELNKSGALNGHVPVTAMNSLIALAQARLLGLGPVVMSNENSAAEPTLVWNGEPVNHQWSKSLEAEQLLAAAIEAQTGERGAYFSLLRPFTELRIAGKFARTERYDDAIVSCNRAFRLSGAEPGWCGECAKCQFVFLALSPFMSRERLVGIIGTDMFAKPELVDGFASLLGLDAHKPFECVGEEAESTVAMSLAARSPEWWDSAVVRALVERAPELLDGDPAMERSLFADREATPVPGIYAEARDLLDSSVPL
ncbi:hypothetical protein FVA74_09835 [Salinibacterium sp. dk2585]|uniref:hypothetical protein n=1 Tax=unclassified Salinibacterium TaxID=2632331 RepID=UPI0011C25383|nr:MULTISPECIES: hypothetical protein [unclassified Salinibacterium]QEE61834.1 hypothetical protein FVA74_09835 [Salinibacterium sp. dk2585]TXK54611.1 hypothetical protein FVP63_06125 [Salinibacterium sp. dk5596]